MFTHSWEWTKGELGELTTQGKATVWSSGQSLRSKAAISDSHVTVQVGKSYTTPGKKEIYKEELFRKI